MSTNKEPGAWGPDFSFLAWFWIVLEKKRNTLAEVAIGGHLFVIFSLGIRIYLTVLVKVIGSLSNHEDDGNKNPINLHI